MGSRRPWHGARTAEGRGSAAARRRKPVGHRTRRGYRSRCSETRYWDRGRYPETPPGHQNRCPETRYERQDRHPKTPDRHPTHHSKTQLRHQNRCPKTRCARRDRSPGTPYGRRTHRPAVPYASRCHGPTTPCWTRHSRSLPTPYRNPPQLPTHRDLPLVTARRNPARTALSRFARLPQPRPRKSPSRSAPTRPYRRSVAQPPPPGALSRGRPKQAYGPANRRSSAHPASLAHSTHPTHPKCPTHQACWAHPAGSPHLVCPTRPARPTRPPHPASPAHPKPDQPSNQNPNRNPKQDPKYPPKPDPRQNPKQDPKYPRRQAPTRNPRRPLPHPTPASESPASPQNQNAVGPHPRLLRQRHRWNQSHQPHQPRHRTPATPPNSSCSPSSSRSPGPKDSPRSSTPAGGAVAASPVIRGRVALPCSCTPRFLVPGRRPSVCGHRLSSAGPVQSRSLLVYGPASAPPHPARTQIQSHPEHAYPQRRTAIPDAVERPAAFPPCVRVTLRVDPARTGTSPRPRGICPERPPTLR